MQLCFFVVGLYTEKFLIQSGTVHAAIFHATCLVMLGKTIQVEDMLHAAMCLQCFKHIAACRKYRNTADQIYMKIVANFHKNEQFQF